MCELFFVKKSADDCLPPVSESASLRCLREKSKEGRGLGELMA
jgi:hypothetical protein